jgi:hypothetical protein
MLRMFKEKTGGGSGKDKEKTGGGGTNHKGGGH